MTKRNNRNQQCGGMMCGWITIICVVSILLNIYLLVKGDNDHCATLYAWFIQETWSADDGNPSAKYDSWYEKCVVQAPEEAKAKREKGKEVIEKIKVELDKRDAQLIEKNKEIEQCQKTVANMKTDLKAAVDKIVLQLPI